MVEKWKPAAARRQRAGGCRLEYCQTPPDSGGCWHLSNTACVGLSHLFQKVTPKEKNHPPGLAWDWSVSVRPRTDPWRGCGWSPWTAPLIIDIKRRSGTRGLQLCRCKPPPKPAKLHDPAELFAQQAKSVLALLAPKDVTETRLRVGRVSCAASGRPPGVSTVRASRRGHDADVILARDSQYSTRSASTSHTFSTKLQLQL